MNEIENSQVSDALESVSRLLHNKSVQGIIIGGLAASILGKPRHTNDIDLVILDIDDDIDGFIDKLKRYGIVPRIADVKDFAMKTRVLIMQHDQSKVPIDISMGILPLEREAVENCSAVSVSGFEIFLPRPEDLIIFKALSQRPKDIEDIRAILDRHTDIDVERVLMAVREFSDILENKEIYNNIKLLIDKRKS